MVGQISCKMNQEERSRVEKTALILSRSTIKMIVDKSEL